MPRPIIKLNDGERDWFMEWSTITDSPRTLGMSLEEFRSYYRDEYGRDGAQDLDGRLERVIATGTSIRHDASAFDTINFNRAGEGETCLTAAQIIEAYCNGGEQKSIAGHRHGPDEVAFCDGKGGWK